MSDKKLIEALRACADRLALHAPLGNLDVIDAAKALIAEADKPIVSRWRCPCCKSHNVQISFPTWYYETRDNDLIFAETDGEADISWWYCEDCDETDSGSPEEVPVRKRKVSA